MLKWKSSWALSSNNKPGYHIGRRPYRLSPAQILEEQKIGIKIIEKDFKRAEKISEKLNNALVIHGDGSDYQLLDEENVGQSDIFVAVTDDDKINMLCSL